MNIVVAVVGCRFFFYRVRFYIDHFFQREGGLGSSNSASGNAELVSGVLVTVNGESLESKSRALEEEP